MNCPLCKSERGHYSTVTYKPIDGGNTFITEAYWFCHKCAKLIYETEDGFIVPEE